MNTKMKTICASVLLCSAGFASQSALAQAYPDFSVDPSDYVSAASLENVFVADKISGPYDEFVTFGVNTFAVSIKWDVSAFSENGGTDTIDNTGIRDSQGYEMYGLFQGSGTYETVGDVTTFEFTTGGSFSFLIDPLRDTVISDPIDPKGLNPFQTTNVVDDVLIATGEIITGEGRLSCSDTTLNCGSFGTRTTFELTEDGKDFFIAPVPFYTVALEAGQFNGFTVADGITQNINGTMDGSFVAVPEPASLALLGLGLIGLGGMRRHRLTK